MDNVKVSVITARPGAKVLTIPLFRVGEPAPRFVTYHGDVIAYGVVRQAVSS